MDFTIKLHQGLGELTFGMPIEAIIERIGAADETEAMENAIDEPTTLLHYESMTLICEGNDPILTCIDISDDEATLFGEKLFGKSEAEITSLMKANGVNDADTETEDWGERRVSFDSANIDFYFEQGELSSITLGK